MIETNSSRIEPPTEADRQERIYDWLIVGACFCLTLTLGETFWTFGIFFKPLQQEFGWNRALVSSITTAFLLGYAISVIVSGRFVDRYNPKPVLIVSALLIVSGFCLGTVGATIDHFRFFLFLVGLGSGATWAVPSSTVQRWFYGRKEAGLALGIVTSGVGVGALVFSPLVNFLVQSYGWRVTFLSLGIFFGSVVGATTLVLRLIPRERMVRDSNRKRIVKLRAQTGNRWYASWAFAGITFVSVVGVLTFQILSTHMVPHATDVGISPSDAAAALGLMGGFSIPGRVLSGILSGRIGWHRLLSLAYFGMGASIGCLWLIKDVWMLYLFAFSYGLFHGVRISAQVGVLPEIFGTHSLGELIGITTAAGQVISALAPFAAGALFDATGNYALAFNSIVALLLAGGVVAGFMKQIAARQAVLEQ